MKKRKWIVALVLVAALVAGGLTAEALAGDSLRYYTVVGLSKMGWMGSAARVSLALDEDIDLTRAICQGAEAKCERILKRLRYTKYGKVVQLYENVKDYPAAIEKLDALIVAHIAELGLNEYAVTAMCEAFHGMPKQYSLLFVRLVENTDKMWGNSSWVVHDYGVSASVILQSNMIEYERLLNKCLYRDAIDWPVYDFVCRELRNEDYWSAGDRYFPVVVANEEMANQMKAFLLETMNGYLKSNDYKKADHLLSFLSRKDWEVEQVSQALFDHGCHLSEQGKYKLAAEFFYMLRDTQDPFFGNDTYFMLLQLQMRNLLEEGKFQDAKNLMAGYFGEYLAILKAIYAEYCQE